jgi:predicted metal-dependent phosphoesterase TrpH
MLLDLHVHSCYSKDAVNTPKTLARIAEEKGIGFAVTDHDNCNAWKELKKFEKRVPIIFGEEIKVKDNKGKLAGEFVALFLNSPIKSRDCFEVIDEIKAQDGLIAVAHPFDLARKPMFKGFRLLEEVKGKVDAIEAFNSRTVFNGFNEKAKQFALQNKLAMTAGSDAHTPKELGNAVTIVKASSLEEARREIKKGRTEIRGKKSSIFVHLKSSLASLGLASNK